MIAYCRDFLKDKLTNLNIIPVYTRKEDADNYKGLVFSSVAPGVERLQKVNTLAAKEDVTVNEVKVRRYRYKIYESTLPVYVQIVAKNLTQAEVFRQDFLKSLGTRFLDPDGNAIIIEATECATLEEVDSIQNPREGYLFTIMCTGGIYRDETQNLVPANIELETEIAKE